VTLIYLVAGEPSGDVLGGRLMAALRQARPELSFAGVGGPRMAEQGIASLVPMRELTVIGFLEAVPRLLRLRRLLRQISHDVLARRPAVLITIDSPGFMLRLLRAVGGHGIARVHYVAPQVWAWHRGRVKRFPGLWDQLLCLLPFEPEFFVAHGVPARFVGHPVLESGADAGDGARFRATHGIAPDAPVLVVMPGSRGFEAARLLPVFGEALRLIAARVPGLVAAVPVAPEVADIVPRAAAPWAVPTIVISNAEEKNDAFAAAAAALTKSGTSTLELAMAGVPMTVAYRVHPLSAAIARRLVHTQFAALVNLLAGREVVPELLQQDCTPARLADAVHRLLTDTEAAAAQRSAFRDIVAQLRPAEGTPTQAAARAVLELLRAAR
jgi:lipid-A-disaccharide synthase